MSVSEAVMLTFEQHPHHETGAMVCLCGGKAPWSFIQSDRDGYQTSEPYPFHVTCCLCRRVYTRDGVLVTRSRGGRR